MRREPRLSTESSGYHAMWHHLYPHPRGLQSVVVLIFLYHEAKPEES